MQWNRTPGRNRKSCASTVRRGDNLLMQFQADLLASPSCVRGSSETTALGAAYLAGLATGV